MMKAWGLSCAFVCWAMAAAGGVAVLLLIVLATDLAFVSAVFAGAAVFLAAGVALTWKYCQPVAAQDLKPAAKAQGAKVPLAGAAAVAPAAAANQSAKPKARSVAKAAAKPAAKAAAKPAAKAVAKPAAKAAAKAPAKPAAKAPAKSGGRKKAAPKRKGGAG